MNRDERLYAFIVSRTSRSRSYVRRFSIHKRWVKASACAAAALFCAAAYGVYGMTQQAAHMRIEQENNRLRIENERQRQKLQKLENRVDAIETDARRLSEKSGVSREDEEGASAHGAGGPELNLDEASVEALEARALRPPVEDRGRRRTGVEARRGVGSGRLDRTLDGAAPPLRGAHRRCGRQSAPLPARVLDFISAVSGKPSRRRKFLCLTLSGAIA